MWAAAAVLLAGCGILDQAPTTGGTLPAPQAGKLVELQEPPLEAPMARVGDIPVRPLSFSWWSESTGERLVRQPGPIPNLRQIPQVPIPSSAATLELVTSVSPQRVEIKTFTGISDDQPEGVVEAVVCPGPCGEVIEGGALALPLHFPRGATIAIVSVFWGAVRESSSGPVPTSDYASYGFRWGETE